MTAQGCSLAESRGQLTMTKLGFCLAELLLAMLLYVVWLLDPESAIYR